MYPYFSRAELQCRCGCGRARMGDGFMRKLVALREAAGFPFIVTSAYRCPEHNARVSSTGERGPHVTGRAIDIAVSHERALWVVSHAVEHGFTGVGVNQKGAVNFRFIHLDDLTAPDYPRPNVWSY